jgi:hypothetical protein
MTVCKNGMTDVSQGSSPVPDMSRPAEGRAHQGVALWWTLGSNMRPAHREAPLTLTRGDGLTLQSSSQASVRENARVGAHPACLEATSHTPAWPAGSAPTKGKG